MNMTGAAIYGFPNELASEIALQAVKDFLQENPEVNILAFLYCLYDD